MHVQVTRKIVEAVALPLTLYGTCPQVEGSQVQYVEELGAGSRELEGGCGKLKSSSMNDWEQSEDVLLTAKARDTLNKMTCKVYPNLRPHIAVLE